MGRPAYPVNLKINPEFIYLIEALKVEGYWSMKNREGAIQNKNLHFLNRIEKLLKKVGLNIRKNILIKLKIPENIGDDAIKLYNQARELKFYIQKSPFDESKRKIVFYLPYTKDIKLLMKIRNKQYKIKLNEGKDEFEITPNGIGSAYGELRFYNINFIRFLENYVGDKKKFGVESFLFNAPKEFVFSALSALIDAEGYLAYYRQFRKIEIEMKNRAYLKQWNKLLKKYAIQSYLSKESDNGYSLLIIQGWEKLDKLVNLGLKLYHSRKDEKLKIIFDSFKRKQISRNTALFFYVNELKRLNKPITARAFSKKLGKSKRVVNHYFTILMRKNLINVDKANVAYLYSPK